MAARVTNNAFGTLSTSITTSSTTIALTIGDGAKFPALGAGDYFYATLVDTDNNIEIIKATARSVDSLTVVRAQDGTTAKAYAVNDRLELRPVAALFNEKVDLETITPVSRGGTGQSTLTAGAILVGNGTLAVDIVAPGTSGNVLVSNGTSWASQVFSVTGRLVGYQVFTSSGAYTKTTNNPSFVIVEVVGGGGGVSSSGGASSFGAFCSATGGGVANAPSSSTGIGGTGSGGDINTTGTRGGAGTGYTTTKGGTGYIQAVGGVSAFVGFGSGATRYSSGNPASSSAGGGGGYSRKQIPASSISSSEAVTVGAAGTGTATVAATSGVVIVWEYV